MNTKLSLSACFLFFTLCANAQDIIAFKSLDYELDYSKFWFDPPVKRPSPLKLRRPAKRRVGHNIRMVPSTWNLGQVVLSDSSIIQGLVSYNIDEDIVQVESNDSVQIFAVDQIWHFEIQKNLPEIRLSKVEVNTKKTMYFSLPYPEKGVSQRSKLFELVTDGNYTSLLRRRSNSYSNGELFLINNYGKITQIKRKRGNAIKAFHDKHEELKKIARKENLNMYDLSDVIRLVEAYNELSGQ